MKKFLTRKNNTPFAVGVNELFKNSVFIVYSKSIGKELAKFPRKNIPDLIFCDSRISLLNGNKINCDTLNPEDANLIPFIYLSTNLKINRQTVGILLSADDYIIKPIDRAEILKKIENNIENEKELSTNFSKSRKKMDNLLSLKNYEEDDRIFIDSRRKPKIIKIGDITFIISKGNDSIINLHNLPHLPIRKTLNSWEDILPVNTFKRINRSTIINLKFVESISRWNRETYIIYLKNIKEPFAVSHRYARAMRSEFK